MADEATIKHGAETMTNVDKASLNMWLLRNSNVQRDAMKDQLCVLTHRRRLHKIRDLSLLHFLAQVRSNNCSALTETAISLAWITNVALATLNVSTSKRTSYAFL